MTGLKSRRISYVIAGVGVACVAAAVVFWRHGSSQTAKAAPPTVPVIVTQAAQQDVPIYYDALGTVQALNTVALRAQVNGQIVSVDFRQGQEVHKGDVLARIDPAPFQAAFDQAVAKKSEDEAQLIDNEKDLARFKTLVIRNAETQQNVDAQQAKVDQTKATIDADQAAIEAARTQLNYATVTAPIDGVVGFRQVDIGNIIHTNDVNPLTVLTQIKPCTVIFTLPQSDLGPVREAMLRGTVSVLAFDQDNKQELAEGKLLLINNQIDQTTGTIQLKAEFPNTNERLWPGAFVHIHILVTTRKDAVTIPAVALQRGPEGFYVWVIKPDDTAEQRPIEAEPVSEDLAIAKKGLEPGERVVVDGQSRLDQGARVAIRTANPASEAVKQQADKS
ncbi:MAG TPA: efflux RND transporter periplasmic adaptor subunit [Xanthobacteraceae bacterium]|nr:efflux RND transporter periplasmic adaptor subunit [Xanthobacteraceae bacterium]